MPTLAVIWRAADLLFATGVDAVVEVLPPLASTPAPTTPPIAPHPHTAYFIVLNVVEAVLLRRLFVTDVATRRGV